MMTVDHIIFLQQHHVLPSEHKLVSSTQTQHEIHTAHFTFNLNKMLINTNI